MPKRASRLVTALAGAGLVYVLSYAPYLRWKFGIDPAPPDPIDMVFIVPGDPEPLDPDHTSHSHWQYRPVEWLVDASPLRPGLLNWAEIVGVRSKTDCDSERRVCGPLCYGANVGYISDCDVLVPATAISSASMQK